MLGFIDAQTQWYNDKTKKLRQVVAEAHVITIVNSTLIIKIKSERKFSDALDAANSFIDAVLQTMKRAADFRIAMSKTEKEADKFKKLKGQLVNPLKDEFEVGGITGKETTPYNYHKKQSQ